MTGVQTCALPIFGRRSDPWYAGRSLPNIDFVQLFIVFLVLLLSLTVHEAAHAFSADRLGDPTARLLGRVSLNPAVHVDLIGTILFPLIALLTNLPAWWECKVVGEVAIGDHTAFVGEVLEAGVRNQEDTCIVMREHNLFYGG